MIDNLENINDLSFPNKIKDGVTMINFFADNSNPCRIFSPVMAQVDNENKTNAKLCCANIKHLPLTAEKYNISITPTVAIFKDGKIVKKTIGIQSKSSLCELLKNNMQ